MELCQLISSTKQCLVTEGDRYVNWIGNKHLQDTSSILISLVPIINYITSHSLFYVRPGSRIAHSASMVLLTGDLIEIQRC